MTAHRQRARLCVLVVVTMLLLLAGTMAPAEARRPLPSYFSLDAKHRQILVVTTDRWTDQVGWMGAYRRGAGGWRRVRGPVKVSLGWNGLVRAHDRRQNTGKTPAGSFGMHYAFGTRPDPGGRLHYDRIDRNDWWPYEPRDPRTYNVMQPHKARTTKWRSGYAEKMSDYPGQYDYGVVMGFNLPRGIWYSSKRRQFVARHPADTRRGGGIFLHVKSSPYRYTAGCVAGPMADIRWVTRWLDPAKKPRILVGPRGWLKRKY